MDVKADTPVQATVGAKYASHHSRRRINVASVLMALRSIVRCTVIEESFAICGIYPYCPNVIPAICTAEISTDENTKILCAIPDLAKNLLRKGERGDADFDRLVFETVRIPTRLIIIFHLAEVLS